MKASLFLLCSLIWPLSFRANAQALPYAQLSIQNVIHNGTACPGDNLDSVKASINKEGNKILLSIAPVSVQVGPGLSPSAGRKNCILTLELGIPWGWQFSISSQTTQGFATLDQGIRSSLTSSNFLSGQPQQVTSTTAAAGPFNSAFAAHTDVDAQKIYWSNCGKTSGAINVNISLRVLNSNPSAYPNATGFMELRNGKVGHSLGFNFRKCSDVLAP